MPLLENPDRDWKGAAFSQITRPYLSDQDWEQMGRSIRTSRYRYTEWANRDGSVAARELYDLEIAPTETVNLATDSGHEPLVASLSGRLRAGWRSEVPYLAR